MRHDKDCDRVNSAYPCNCGLTGDASPSKRTPPMLEHDEAVMRECCAEILRWQETGILQEGGYLRDLADKMFPQQEEHTRLRVAEGFVASWAMRQCAADLRMKDAPLPTAGVEVTEEMVERALAATDDLPELEYEGGTKFSFGRTVFETEAEATDAYSKTAMRAALTAALNPSKTGGE